MLLTKNEEIKEMSLVYLKYYSAAIERLKSSFESIDKRILYYAMLLCLLYVLVPSHYKSAEKILNKIFFPRMISWMNHSHISEGDE